MTPETEPSLAAKQRACDLANELEKMADYWKVRDASIAYNRCLLVHAQTIQRVSDAIRNGDDLQQFVLPKSSLEELREAMDAADGNWGKPGNSDFSASLHAELIRRNWRGDGE